MYVVSWFDIFHFHFLEIQIHYFPLKLYHLIPSTDLHSPTNLLHPPSLTLCSLPSPSSPLPSSPTRLCFPEPVINSPWPSVFRAALSHSAAADNNTVQSSCFTIYAELSSYSILPCHLRSRYLCGFPRHPCVWISSIYLAFFFIFFSLCILNVRLRTDVFYIFFFYSEYV